MYWGNSNTETKRVTNTQIWKVTKIRKGNIIAPREEERLIKVRITNKNYQTSKKEEEKGEECKEEEHKDSQEEGKVVIEAEHPFDITYIFNDKNNSVELYRTES